MNVFRPLSGAEEGYRFAFALVVVTIVYMLGFVAVGSDRQRAVESELHKLNSENSQEVMNEVARLGGWEHCEVFNRQIPCPTADSANAHRLAKALAVLGPVPKESKEALEDNPWRRLFGEEQYVSYLLAAWATLLLYRQRKLVRRALHACNKLSAAERRDVNAHAPALRSRLDRGLAIVRFVIWATPTIGFIGTVRHMGNALTIADNPENISQITAFLGTAFDTTMIGLVLSVALQLMQHSYERDEDDFMSEVNAPARAAEQIDSQAATRDGSLA